MESLKLADLSNMTDQEIIDHLITEYSDGNSIKAADLLSDKKVIVAYEHVGSWGCDSKSFFILKDLEENYYEIQGGHCSCYGFEGQLDLEKTTLIALKKRSEGDYLFSTGGYDDESEANVKKVREFILAL